MPVATRVRYVSPFGSPATMSAADAERYLAEDERLWNLMAECGLLRERELRIGPPRLNDVTFRHRHLPVWRSPSGEPFELIRELVWDAERGARTEGEPFVVAERDGRFAAFPKRLVIDGDDVRWETNS